MFRFKTHAAVVLLAVAARAEDPATLMSRAAAAYKAQEYAKSARLYEAAANSAPIAKLPAYNAACCHALLGNAEDAFAWLDKTMKNGWRDVQQLNSDADLESLHDDQRWPQTVKRCRQALADFLKSLKQPALRQELLTRLKEDQRIRFVANPDLREMMKIDADNTAFLKSVIDKHGWPGKSMVGSDGAQAAFFLVQHAAAAPLFQKRCLELLTGAVEQNEASPSHLAYLTDRVLVFEGKPQRYGTQFHQVNGRSEPFPIEDEPNVDTRRKTVGLPPLAEYIRQVRQSQQP